jgi:hypothetical protein
MSNSLPIVARFAAGSLPCLPVRSDVPPYVFDADSSASRFALSCSSIRRKRWISQIAPMPVPSSCLSGLGFASTFVFIIAEHDNISQDGAREGECTWESRALGIDWITPGRYEVASRPCSRNLASIRSSSSLIQC